MDFNGDALKGMSLAGKLFKGQKMFGYKLVINEK
jgi:hypothetical protein